MKKFREWISRCGGLFNKSRADRELDDEIEGHLQLHIEDNVRLGLSLKEARRQALIKLGGMDSTKELYRDQRGVPWLETFWQDVRYGARSLRKNPGFTIVAVLTLALGIGANTAIFSIVDAVLLRPLAYPDSGRLVWLAERGSDWSGGSIAYPNFVDWKNQQSVFQNFGVYNGNSFTLTGAGETIRIPGAVMSADVFAALRTQPAMGRFFGEEEDKPGAAPVAVISHALWRNRFGGDAEILNRTINLNGNSYTILGVMPPGFDFPSKVDVWTPVGPYAAQATWQKRDYHPGLYGLARLKDGVTLEKARADLDVIAVRLQQQYPESNKTRLIQIDGLLDNKVGNIRRALWILLGAVTFVLMIACANVANLLLARAAARGKEMAVRAALGAGRWRIARQLLTESSLLALLGAGVGLLFANGALRVVSSVAGENIPRAAEISLDPRVLLFSGVMALLTGILFGLAPAWQAGRTELQGALKEAARGSTSRAGLRQGLIIAEVALTFVLLVGAGLLLLSFHRLTQVNPGFSTDRVLTFQIDLPEQKYPSFQQQNLFYRALLEKMRAAPGVQSASLTSKVPLNQNHWDMRFVIEERPEPPPHLQPSLRFHLVAPDYFRAMGIPLLQGRDFTPQDDRRNLSAPAGAEWGSELNAIIIDEQFAKRHWPNQSPVGQRVRIPFGAGPIMTVVGVVGRIKVNDLNEKEDMVQAYFPIFQQPLRGMTVVIKTTADPSTLFGTLRQQVSQLDPELPILGFRTMDELRSDNVASDRLNLSLIGAFAAVALVLAIIGLYGLLSFIVAQRQREIGVRMALGAKRFDVLNLIVGQGMRLTLAGIVIGILGSIALTRVLTSVLFNVTPTDPFTFITVTLSLCTAALAACYFPARRATKVDPMVALRTE